jgi:hypothetical protein
MSFNIHGEYRREWSLVCWGRKEGHVALFADVRLEDVLDALDLFDLLDGLFYVPSWCD